MLYTSTERSSFVAVPLALWLGIWPSLPISSWGLLTFVSRIWKFVVFTKIKDCSAWLSLKECILNNYVNIYTLFLQDLFFVSQLQLAPHNNPYPLHGQPVTFPLTDVFNFLEHCDWQVHPATDSNPLKKLWIVSTQTQALRYYLNWYKLW